MTAKDLTDSARKNEATSDEYFELGVVLLRKRYYVPSGWYYRTVVLVRLLSSLVLPSGW